MWLTDWFFRDIGTQPDWYLIGTDGYGLNHVLGSGDGEAGRARLESMQAEMLARLNARRLNLGMHNRRTKGARLNLDKGLCIRFEIVSSRLV